MYQNFKNIMFPVHLRDILSPEGRGDVLIHVNGHWTWETIEELDQGFALVEYWIERNEDGVYDIRRRVVKTRKAPTPKVWKPEEMCSDITQVRFPVYIDEVPLPEGLGDILVHPPGDWSWETMEELDQGFAYVEYWVDRDESGALFIDHEVVRWI